MTAWKLAYHANCWGPLGGDAVGVTSITRLAYRTFGDMQVAARDIAAAGYEGIEFFDGNVLDGEGDDYPVMRGILAETQLCASRQSTAAAISSSPTCLTRNSPASCRRHEAAQALGAEHLVVGGGARRYDGTRESDYDALAAALDKVLVDRQRARAQGALPSASVDDRRKPRGGAQNLFARRGSASVRIPRIWRPRAATSPRMVREHASRISYVHLKGWQREPFAFVPVGRGDCDNGAVIRALKDIGYAGWICNELDAWPDPAAGARESRAFVEARCRRPEAFGSRRKPAPSTTKTTTTRERKPCA